MARKLTDAEFEALLVSNIALAAYVARRCVERPEDVEDRVQDSLLSAWRRRRSYDPDRPTRTGRPPFAAFLGWCVRSVVQQRQMWCRRKGRASARVVYDVAALKRVPVDADPAEPLEREEVVNRVRGVIEKLNPHRRRIVEGRMRGETLADVAAGSSRQAAHIGYRQAVDAMREELATAFGE